MERSVLASWSQGLVFCFGSRLLFNSEEVSVVICRLVHRDTLWPSGQGIFVGLVCAF
ncbi:hypothetical protein N665_1327s0016 [Sinapis alba]|nr:hypothetical protein N665_1327s0016 [Sinapis alba]